MRKNYFLYFGKRKLGPICFFGGSKLLENEKQHDMKTKYKIWQVNQLKFP